MATHVDIERQLARLIGKRDAIFERVNRVYKLALNISSFESRSNEQFMVDSETIDDLHSKFESIIDQINDLVLTGSPDESPDYASLLSFEDLYSRIKRTRNKINSVSDVKSSSLPSRPNETRIKLPPVEIPSFDGSTEKWPIFYESFKANIHNNTQLTDSQRVQYLIGKLTHSALKITAGIVPTADTYSILWNSLVNKYQDKRSLGTHYMNNIFDIKACSNTATSLDTFIEKYSASIAALKQLNITDLSDFILLHCALRKVDSHTAQAFELSVRGTEIPSSKDFIAFVRDQIKILSRCNLSVPNANPRSQSNVNKQRERTKTGSMTRVDSYVAQSDNVSHSATGSCGYCRKTDHVLLNKCTQFKTQSDPQKRFEFVKSKHGCVNCLSTIHTVSSCKSSSLCELCQKRHHTLLHFENKNSNTHTHTAQLVTLKETDRPASNCASASAPATVSSPSLAPRPSPSVLVDNPSERTSSDSSRADLTNVSVDAPTSNGSLSLSVNVKPSTNILLSTAQVYASANNTINNKILIRCLIDNGSQNNLITVDCCKLLNLNIIPLTNSYVRGVGLSSRPIHGYVNIHIQSRVYPKNKYNLQALVVDCVTDQMPTHFIERCDMGHLDSIPLADLTWNIPGNIDLVLGAQLFPYIYLGDRIDSGTRAPPALSTAFGYVLMGDCPITQKVSTSFSALALNDLIQQFWELEEIPHKQFLSPEDTECENIYSSSVTRDEDGRYSVALPFCRDPSELGNSRSNAHRRLMTLERKFKQVPTLRENYNAVIAEYIENGYLTEVPEPEVTDDGYYIPHHAVVRPDKPLPRIVLDASAKTHTGFSLNDILYTGPNLQADLFLLLLDFRLFPVAITADIKQMYLQIGVPDDQRRFLQILFRFNENDSIKTFQFNRIPFGLKPSPFLAMRTVRQLATDMAPDFPEASQIAESKLYMDDLVHSVPDAESAARLARELISLFKCGAFDLVKWSSNCAELLESLSTAHRGSVDFTQGSVVALKVLGLSWEPSEDIFFFTTSQVTDKCTKRNILSVVARLFDVLGLVAPVILFAKLLIKELWLNNIGWDDTPPESVVRRFAALTQELPLLSTLKIPRHVGVSCDCTVNIVAFADASMNGYGSVVYLHISDASGIMVRLVCAKSKVSPTKVTTLARLELCAALLMSKLIKTVHDAYRDRVKISGIFAFSDSTVALSWIHSSPHRWSVFVSNRVAQCQENLASQNFYHVAGIENPSDCLSRGLLPSQIVGHDLWWNGPGWMRRPVSEWPIESFSPPKGCEVPEQRASVFAATTAQRDAPVLHELAQRLSSWDKLLKAVVYVLKFLKRLPSVDDINSLIVAEKAVIRAVQSMHFSEDIALLKKGKLPSKKLRNLCTFLDEEGILRIGGRLAKSDLPFEAKHPALLPKHDHVVDLIIRHYHVLNCHTGPGLLVSILRQRYWILDARTVVRAKVRQCNACFRVNPSHPTPKMADLPAFRIREAKAFTHTGVDYAGPLRITLTRRRGQHAQKAYICLFVCLVTKAIHIELVSDLTSDSYLAAFKRFIARRGPVSCLYSDNGTNFVGAKAQLDEFNKALRPELISHRIDWKMIPPRAPHFGAMWESNVKSLKTHLYRVIGSQLLTYEELQTVLVQIESVMNSRPLNVVSSDPHPEVITPAHFLMSTPLQYLPASDISDTSLVQRKKLLDHMVQSFWKKWRLEYLHTLQVRLKWATPDNPVQVGKVVLVGQDDSPPLNWPLGVITETFPGSDNIIRVAMVKTRFGTFKRPVVKLYPIPTQ